MCFFGGGGSGSGPQSSADMKNNTNEPPVQKVVNRAVQNQNTTDRNTMRRADSYGSRQAASSTKSKSNAQAVQGGKNIMSALNNYNKANKKTILGS
tara:strand:- start:810 stop:1097 length:288 start_codon:yes stop_codon:yes gene_type:complete